MVLTSFSFLDFSPLQAGESARNSHLDISDIDVAPYTKKLQSDLPGKVECEREKGRKFLLENVFDNGLGIDSCRQNGERERGKEGRRGRKEKEGRGRRERERQRESLNC